jgi:hypothetical protein
LEYIVFGRGTPLRHRRLLRKSDSEKGARCPRCIVDEMRVPADMGAVCQRLTDSRDPA